MIDEKISRYRDLLREIEMAVRADDPDSVRKLDQEIVGIWKTIVEYDPQTDEERRMLAVFFLDQLISDDKGNLHKQTIRKKILTMI